MSIKLAKGDVLFVAKQNRCTRQYASEVISAYKQGIVRRGRKAAGVIKAYKVIHQEYLDNEKDSKRLQPNCTS